MSCHSCGKPGVITREFYQRKTACDCGARCAAIELSATQSPAEEPTPVPAEEKSAAVELKTSTPKRHKKPAPAAAKVAEPVAVTLKPAAPKRAAKSPPPPAAVAQPAAPAQPVRQPAQAVYQQPVVKAKNNYLGMLASVAILGGALAGIYYLPELTGKTDDQPAAKAETAAAKAEAVDTSLMPAQIAEMVRADEGELEISKTTKVNATLTPESPQQDILGNSAQGYQKLENKRETPLSEAKVTSQPSSYEVLHFEEKIQPFLQQYCVSCHGPDEQEGDLRLDDLNAEIASVFDMELWTDILDNLNAGSMPPKKAKQPGHEDILAALDPLTHSLSEARLYFASKSGKSKLRRLNKREYIHTVEQLTGVRITPEDIPDDTRSYGFDTVASGLTVSSQQIYGYLELAEKAIKVACNTPKNSLHARQEAIDFDIANVRKKAIDVYKNRHVPKAQQYIDKIAALRAKGLKDEDIAKQTGNDGLTMLNRSLRLSQAVLDSPLLKYEKLPYTDTGSLILPHADKTLESLAIPLRPPKAAKGEKSITLANGHYKLRLKCAQVGGTSYPPVLKVSIGVRRSEKIVFENIITSTPDSPETIEIPFYYSHDDRGQQISFRCYNTAFEKAPKQEGSKLFTEMVNQLTNRRRKAFGSIDKNQYGIWLGEAQLIPVEGKSSLIGYNRIFFNGDDDESDSYAKEVIHNFAKEAFHNNPPTRSYIDKLFKLYQQSLADGSSFKEALAEPLSIVLASPSFLYLAEDSDLEEGFEEITQNELATRLSYFLWSCQPDDTLKKLARDGKLKDLAVLQEQVMRMIQDPKFDHFNDGFIHQWLKLYKVDEVDPNDFLYSNWTHAVAQASKEESKRFFNTLIRKNRPVHELIKADYLVVNRLMADYYGLPIDKLGPHFQPIAKPHDSPRGGLLSQASFLTMTGNGDRTSPVERGAYILYKFLDFPEMQPPPNVPQLSIDSGDIDTTVPDAMAAHTQQVQCAACHHTIDPIGLGLENFDAAGNWRTEEILPASPSDIKKMRHLPLSTQGQMPDGQRQFDSYHGLQDALIQDRDALVRSLAKAMLTYSLARPVGFQDTPLIEDIVETVKLNNYTAQSLIFAIVLSDTFQQK